jgi:hypothetical protein
MRPSLAPRLCAVLAILACCAFPAALAQNETNQPGTDVVSDNPIQAEPGLAVLLQTKDDRRQFHFGEMIEMRLQYVAPQSGHYVHVNLNKYISRSSAILLPSLGFAAAWLAIQSFEKPA